jgi:hypothetical protein
MCRVSNILSVEAEAMIPNPTPKPWLQNHACKDNRGICSTKQIGPVIIPISESLVDFNVF